jgi:hypothetical protein
MNYDYQKSIVMPGLTRYRLNKPHLPMHQVASDDCGSGAAMTGFFDGGKAPQTLQI